MSNEIVRVKGRFDFAKAHEESIKHRAYYEEGLLIDVAARIIDVMDARGISRSELARKLKVSPAYITKILRGHANLSLESLSKVAFALDLKWECILIPKESEIGIFSLTDESGTHQIRTVETATVATGNWSTATANEYKQDTEEVRYELPLSA